MHLFSCLTGKLNKLTGKLYISRTVRPYCTTPSTVSTTTVLRSVKQVVYQTSVSVVLLLLRSTMYLFTRERFVF